MNRDEARLLARQFAVQLRHLREFRGQAYVGAAPQPHAGAPRAHADASAQSHASTPRSRTVAPPAHPGATSSPDSAMSSPAGPSSHDTALPSQRPTDPSRLTPRTWPSGQVDTHANQPDVITSPPAEAPRRSAPTGSHGTARDPVVTPTHEIVAAVPARETWPSGQVVADPPSADRTATLHADASPPAGRLPVRLPTLPAEDPPAADAGVRDKARTWTAAEKLDYLRRKNLGNCQRCKLAATRTQIVFGVGDPEADVLFIGEAPGFDEDREGEPFVGAAGRRLTQWLGRLGLGRDQVYIANVLKCRPPGNRDPERDEVERCSPFLRAQIRAIAPKVIVALGRHAGMLLLGGQQERTLRDMRGRSWEYEDPSGAHQAALFVTYHPSYVIRRERELSPGQRNPADDTVMADLQQALSSIKQPRQIQ